MQLRPPLGETPSPVARARRQALDFATKLAPSVILLDLTMPVMDGWEFIHAYRQSSRSPAPMLLVSAIDNLPVRAKEIGAAGYGSKPLDLKALLADVKRVTAGTASAAPL